jgi:hypothetical protein
MEPDLTVPQALAPVLDELKKLEPLFHAAHAQASTQQFEQLVAPEFWEVGASGKRYSRAFVLKVLAERIESPDVALWHTDDFCVAELGAGNYLLTYTLHQPDRVTRRASIWRRTASGWQVVYHQGTVVQA